MKTEVRLSDQVNQYVRRQPPETRRRLKDALRGLAAGTGDVKSLEGSLAGYARLRVGGHRIIFATEAGAKGPIVNCLYVNQRGIVYEIFEKLLNL